MSTRRSARRALAPALTLAFLVGALGLGLRHAIPVTPVDEAYRDVVRYYRALDQAGGASNSRETSAPY